MVLPPPAHVSSSDCFKYFSTKSSIVFPPLLPPTAIDESHEIARDMSSKESYRVELRSAARQLNLDTLISPLVRAAELLVDIEPDAHAPASSVSASASSSAASALATPSTSSAARPLSHLHPDASAYRRRLRSAAASGDIAATPPAGVSYISTPVPDDDGLNSDGGNDRYLLAKSYFDCHEYRRAAHVLRGQTGKKAGFLRCYALYLVTLLPSPL
ncbi:hypothetical protein B296_00040165 [Ensete ventricosum]|uniref:Cdc23 domain-containing protein n=1 Tax=Ensete ventricosum TaxID=4639 RepID=A0A426XXI7_ENSVE|nr:hypothetical protein B296_00040165 [Ensete ventricosum]